MRIVLKIAAWILVAAVVLVVGAVGYRAFRVNERARETALRGPNAVQESMFVPIGGIEQWVSIRG